MRKIYANLAFFALLLLATAGPALAQFPLPAGGGTATVTVGNGDLITDDGDVAGNYADDYRGALTLVPANAGDVITLNFNTFELEQGFDFVAVFDGPDASYPMILCATSGNTPPAPVVGTNPDGMTVSLVSDGSFSLAGFDANVATSPGPGPFPGNERSVPFIGSTTIDDPCGMTIYDNGGSSCDYLPNSGVPGFTGTLTLNPPSPDFVVQLNFTSFAVEQVAGSPVQPDVLRITDGNSQDDPFIDEFSTNPGTITADVGPVPNPEGSLTLQFLSDWIEGGPGFSADVVCVPRPTAYITSNDTTICEGNPVDVEFALTGTAPYNFRYTDGQDTFVVSGHNANTFSTTVAPPVGVVTYTMLEIGDDNLPLRPVDSATTMTVTVDEGPEARMAQTSVTICQGNPAEIPIVFQGAPPFEFEYSDGTATTTVSGINDFNYSLMVSPADTTTYRITRVGDNLCGSGSIALDSSVVFVAPPPTATLNLVGKNDICPGGFSQLSVSFTNSGPWSFEWTDGTNNFTVLNTTRNPYILNVSPDVTTTYELVSVSQPDCPPGNVSGSITIGILPTPTVTAIPVAGCYGGEGVIEASAVGGSGPYRYSFGGGSYTVVDTARLPQRANPYTVIASDQNGCTDTTSVVLDGALAPTITSFTNITETSIQVEWTATPGAGVIYDLQFRAKRSAQPWLTIPSIPVNFRNVGLLEPNVLYEFRVRAVCGRGNESDWSDPDSVSTLPQSVDECGANAPYPIPGGVYLSNITPFSATVNWNPIDGPGYIISYGLASINPRVWPQFVICNQNPLPNKVSYAITNLTPGSRYRVRIRTNCSNCTTALRSTDNRSDWTRTYDFKTPQSRNFNDREGGANPLSVYPNPNNGRFTLAFQSAEPAVAHVRLHAVDGRMVWREEFALVEGENQLKIRPGQLPPGIYLLQFETGGERKTTRVIIN